MKKLLRCWAVTGILLSYTLAFATDIERKSYTTKSVSEPITLDGVLNDPQWETVEWATDFIQRRPEDGAEPIRQTAFKVLYDLENLYIGFRCFDDEPEEIVRRMSRRDGFEGDWIEVNIDSYNDKRTAFSFTTSASGVKGDEFITDNGNNWDSSWDPIWYTKTNIDSLGWTAEIRIPLTQLRFANKDELTWGIQVQRRDFRADQNSSWQHIPQNAGGWVSNFGELRGLKGIKPQKQLEIQPYVVGSVETSEKEAGNPFATGSRTRTNVGVDGKIGITSDLTLDFTINPDFGQVEADPSALNIDGFQIFFDERRPFFIENSNLFTLPISRAEAGGPFWNDDLFYSRRIGRSPRGSVRQDYDFIDYPNFTSILGAAKFSGKTKNGLSVGILESVTSKEYASISTNGEMQDVLVEPLTNYMVTKVSQDFKQGESVVGLMLTSVNRNLEEGMENDWVQSATTGGIDLLHTWKDRQWVLRGNGFFSHLKGTSAAILNIQQSFEHYFQRPDADHLQIDESRNSLTGTGGRLSIANYGGDDNISFETGVTWRSPELDLNDLGFMNTADGIYHFFWGGFNHPKEAGIMRRYRVNYNHYFTWDFSGRNIYQAFNTNAHTQFTNFWRFGTGLTWELKDISNKALFGGPALRQSSGLGHWFYVESDTRKKMTLFFNAFHFFPNKNNRDAVRTSNYNFAINYQPTNAVSVQIRPSLRINRRLLQNVDLFNYEGQDRYVTGKIKQKTFSLSTRINVNITPNLTIQYWGQPFISRGNYNEFKYITDPLATRIEDRYLAYNPAQVLFNAEADNYQIDENMDGASDYTFGNPDFNFIQFRSNMVMRWEYKAGSEFYLVWSQSNTSNGDPSEELIPSLSDHLFGNKPMNIFLIKYAYRFVR